MGGIPMAMVMFQSMGERMNKFFSVIIKRVRGWVGCSRTEANEFDLIFASGLMSMIVMSGGATMYHFQEGWSAFDSLYYSFITLSTIGFGDFVALQNDRALHVSQHLNVRNTFLQYCRVLHAANHEMAQCTAEPHTIIIVAKRYSDIANTSYLFSYLIEAQIIVPLYYILPLV